MCFHELCNSNHKSCVGSVHHLDAEVGRTINPSQEEKAHEFLVLFKGSSHSLRPTRGVGDQDRNEGMLRY